MPVLAQALFVLLLWTLAGAAAWALFVAVGARMSSVAASEWNQAPTQAVRTVTQDHAVLRRARATTPSRDVTSRLLAPTAEPSPEHRVAALRN